MKVEVLYNPFFLMRRTGQDVQQAVFETILCSPPNVKYVFQDYSNHGQPSRPLHYKLHIFVCNSTKADLIASHNQLLLSKKNWVLVLESSDKLSSHFPWRKAWLHRKSTDDLSINYLFGESPFSFPLDFLQAMLVKKILLKPNCKKILPWSKYAAGFVGRHSRVSRLVLSDARIRDKMEVLYPCIKEREIKKEKTDDDKVRVLFAGRFFFAKGANNLLYAFDKLSKKYDLKLSMFTDLKNDAALSFSGYITQDYSFFKKILKKNSSVDLLPFKAFATEQQKERFFRNVFAQNDIFVLPTKCDTFGFALLEAMSLGLPAISTNAFAIPEIVEDGKSGLLADFSAENYKYNRLQEDKKLTEQTTQLLEQLVQNASLRKRMGRKGKRIARKKFSYKKRSNRLKEIFEESL